MKKILPIIVISQFLCTSVWFAGNAVLPDLVVALQLDLAFLAHLTSAVQIGFILGTLIFAIFTISDRFSPSLVFFICALLAAVFNLLIVMEGIAAIHLLFFRFMTGFFLAGIYPVGMKIASDYYQKGLGASLGFLVGALVLGTAFPHLIRSFTTALPWKFVVYSTSLLAAVGGSLMYFMVPNGPYRKPGFAVDFQAFFRIFNKRTFRKSAFGYFGHMWELYAFWAFVPVMLLHHQSQFPTSAFNISLYSFYIIGIGGLACFGSGLLSERFGAKKVAAAALFLSCLCCLFSPVFLLQNSPALLIAFLLFWGVVVVADSPLFSTLVAQSAPSESRGTALTIVNCIGFSITVVSLQITNSLALVLSPHYLFVILAIGPILGLVSLMNTKSFDASKKSIQQE